MSVFKRVTARNRCPICGGPDWCFWIPMSNYDGDLLCCQRHTIKEDVIGRDGNFYVHVKFSDGNDSKGASIFEEANQRRQRQENFKNSDEQHEFKKARERERVLTPVNMVYAKENAELHKIYNAMLDLLCLEPRHREYLHKEGWTDEMIEKHKIRSFPEKDFTRFLFRKESFKGGNISRKKLALKLIEMFGENALCGVPGAYKDKGGNWTFYGRSGILFPQYDIYHRLYRVRIRMDFRDVNADIIPGTNGADDSFTDPSGKKWFISMGGVYEIVDDPEKGRVRTYLKSGGKYRNFSSFKEDEEAEKQGFLINTLEMGCEAKNQLGFYYNESRDDMYIAYITEGEKKGILSNEKLRAPFISIPGVSSWSSLFSEKAGERPIDVLKQKGVKIIIVALDADKTVNARVMQVQNATVEALKKEGFTVGIAEWDINLGKGIDDLLAAGHKPQYILG